VHGFAAPEVLALDASSGWEEYYFFEVEGLLSNPRPDGFITPLAYLSHSNLNRRSRRTRSRR